MRISDWSSDVCSSDLIYPNFFHFSDRFLRIFSRKDRISGHQHIGPGLQKRKSVVRTHTAIHFDLKIGAGSFPHFLECPDFPVGIFNELRTAERSEEHTAEIQSLKRSSYAVF